MKNFSKTVTKFSVALAGSLMLVSCGGSSSSSGGDQGGQVVNATSLNVELNVTADVLALRFNEKIKDLSKDNFELKNGTKDVEFSLKQNGQDVNLTSKDLKFGTEYTLRIKAQDLAGNKLDKSKTFSLQTKVAQTDQTKCYDSSGNNKEIACTDPKALGQDGYYASKNLGLKHSFETKADVVVVIDNLTKLEWQDNAAVASNSLSHAAAVNYCTNLDLNGKGWRLPEMYELFSILNHQTKTATAKFSEFSNIASSQYWTNIKADDENAFLVGFNTARIYSGKQSQEQDVICVRGKKTQETCTRDDKTKTVTCTKANLQWQDDESTKGETNKKTWQAAINYCEDLNLAGKTDWRLPNINELMSVYPDGSTINEKFKNAEVAPNNNYWSSTTNVLDDRLAFVRGFNSIEKTNKHYTRCVRVAN